MSDVTTNTVMAAAKYDGLIRFDCDDIMAPTMVETIMKEKDDADYVYFQMENFGKKVGITKTCGQVWMRHSCLTNLEDIFLGHAVQTRSWKPE